MRDRPWGSTLLVLWPPGVPTRWPCGLSLLPAAPHDGRPVLGSAAVAAPTDWGTVLAPLPPLPVGPFIWLLIYLGILA